MKYSVLKKLDTDECLIFWNCNPADILYHYLVWDLHVFDNQNEAEQYIADNELHVMDQGKECDGINDMEYTWDGEKFNPPLTDPIEEE